MARTNDNIFTQGLSGAVGGLMLFKTWNGKTYVYKKAKNPTKQSQKQKDNRAKFRKASGFAKRMMKDPVMKAEYLEKAKKLQLPNAYTAAVTEYMRNPEIGDLDTSGYEGKAGGVIKANVDKKDFETGLVEVIILDEKGGVIEGGSAIKGTGNEWIYRTTATVEKTKPLQILIRAKQRTSNTYEKQFLKVLLNDV